MADRSLNSLTPDAEGRVPGHEDNHYKDSKTKTNHLDSALSSGQTFGADAETLSDKGRKSRQLSSRYISGIDVETVDRGVGPTPFSEPQVSVFGSTSVDFPANGTPSGFMISPFIDPRNGFVDPVYAGLGLSYPAHYPAYINQPLPFNSNTLEGRYQWPPPTYRHPLSSSAIAANVLGAPFSSGDVQADVPIFGMRGSGFPDDQSVSQLASRIHWQQHMQRAASFYHGSAAAAAAAAAAMHGRRLSQASLSALSLGHGSMPGDLLHPFTHHGAQGTGYLSMGSDSRGYFTGSDIRGYASGSDIPAATLASGNMTLSASLEGSRLASPRHGVAGGRNRKRALSHSPISDYLDIQSLTRSSDGSLQMTSLLGHHASRGSSVGSGSYGHLSAASMGTSNSPLPPLFPNPYFPHGPIMAPPFFYPPMLPPGMMGRPHPGLIPSAQHVSNHHQMTSMKPNLQPPANAAKEAGNGDVSSSVEPADGGRKSKIKKEPDEASFIETEHEDEEEELPDGYGAGHIPQEGEPDFIETNCHWEGCSLEFESQDKLVKHLNHEHIQSNKKCFICRWKDCSREEKPFKAQYMLVVHMRRHTGEKPHHCTFEGCHKAYSRLENLKTHLRSHTGEKPYLCEFPGCTKAFSNASDRAKHQNRTHSNAKPYACKAAGCTKRYTDPSSLRKHVKTVHGPEFYANKRHKGDGGCCRRDDADQDQDDRDVDDNGNVGGFVGANQIQDMSTAGRRQSQDTVLSSIQSPQSSPEVNVTCSLQPDILDDQLEICPEAVGTALEDEFDITEVDEVEVGSLGSVLARCQQMSTGRVLNQRMKGRLNVKTASPGGNLPFFNPIDPHCSKTCPLDSCTHTIHSDSCQVNRSTDSRHSSGSPPISANRYSIDSSPYEYDIADNRPLKSAVMPEIVTHSPPKGHHCSIGTMSAMLQKANISSKNIPKVALQTASDVQIWPRSEHQEENCSATYSNDQLVRYFSTQNEYQASVGIKYVNNICSAKDISISTTGHVKKHAELKLCENDVKLLRPLVKPQRQGNSGPLNQENNTGVAHTSQSSATTDLSFIDNITSHNSPAFETLLADVDSKDLEDSIDIIIPDDMQKFLNERCRDSQSRPTSEDMQRYYDERYIHSRDHILEQRQLSQLSIVDSGAVDSGCASQLSGNSSSMGVNVFNEATLASQTPHRLSPRAGKYSTQRRHFSPLDSNLHAQSHVNGGVRPTVNSATRPHFGQPAQASSLPHHRTQCLGCARCLGSQWTVLAETVTSQAAATCPVEEFVTAAGIHQHNDLHRHMGHQPCQDNCRPLLPPHLSHAALHTNPTPPTVADYGIGHSSQLGHGVAIDKNNFPFCCCVDCGGGHHNPANQNARLSVTLQWPHQGVANLTAPHHYPTHGNLLGSCNTGDCYPGAANVAWQRQADSTSPQVQVPHISQSKIPANAKAVSRNAEMQRQQAMNRYCSPGGGFHDNGHPPALPNRTPVPQHLCQQPCHQFQRPFPQDSSAERCDALRSNACANQLYQLAYRPVWNPTDSHFAVHQNLEQKSFCIPNVLDLPKHQQRSYPEYSQTVSETSTALALTPSGASTPTGMFRHPHPPSFQLQGGLVDQRSPHSKHVYQPFHQHAHRQTPGHTVCAEYANGSQTSPNCNHVTSTTDLKEMVPGSGAEPTGIESFMENISSLSAEHFMYGGSLAGQLDSQTSVAGRPRLAGSGRRVHDPMLGMSNMVVNDMNSMLTQLAEENKYLAMQSLG